MRARRAAARAAALLLAAAAFSCGKDPARPSADGPVITAPGPLSMAEVALLNAPVSAVDPKGAAVALGLSGAPAFARLSDNGDGTGTLTLSPALGDAGSFDLTLTAAGSTGTGTAMVSVSVAAVTRAPGGLFYEPPSFCLSGTATGKTFTLYNRSTESLIIQPVRVVSGTDLLDARRVLAPQTFEDIPWTWTPAGPYPRTDTLVALTNDPEWPRLELPLRREDPAGFSDFTAPDPPLLAFPDDGAVFALGFNPVTMVNEAEIPVGWSLVDDCSGIDHYRIQIATDPGFTNVLLAESLAGADTVVVAEEGDQGVAYWRVLAVDGEGLTSVPSAVRSWTITGP